MVLISISANCLGRVNSINLRISALGEHLQEEELGQEDLYAIWQILLAFYSGYDF